MARAVRPAKTPPPPGVTVWNLALEREVDEVVRAVVWQTGCLEKYVSDGSTTTTLLLGRGLHGEAL